jgi:hypothetical protein
MPQNTNLSANGITNLEKIIFKTIIFKHIEENIFLLELSATTIIIMIIKMLCMFWEDNNNFKNIEYDVIKHVVSYLTELYCVENKKFLIPFKIFILN